MKHGKQDKGFVEMSSVVLLLAAVMLIAIGFSTSHGATVAPPRGMSPMLSASDPAYGIAGHSVNEMSLSVCNNGTLGNGFTVGGVTGSFPAIDFFTGEPAPSCEYPKDSSFEYMFAATLWVGAVVGEDTLVSTGADGWMYAGFEFSPDEAPAGNLVTRTHPDPLDVEYDGARSEQDFIAVCTDTFTENVVGGHNPLGIKVTQTSMAWSDAIAEDLILMEYGISNIGQDTLLDTYVGFYVDGDVVHASQGVEGVVDDVCGFIKTADYSFRDCEFMDTLNIAWIADNDGDPSGGWTEFSPRHVTGMALVRVPSEYPTVSFNWWVSNGNAALDFGPRHKDDDYDFGTGGTGTPVTDAAKYHLMSNGEVDYNQYFAATITEGDPLWTRPPEAIAGDIADGFDTRYLVSVGPFEIWPGQTLPIWMAYVAGKDLHVNAANGANLPHSPLAYENNLDFSDLIGNTRWAGWIYDSPGVDTDSDGYGGNFVICGDDTMWVRGDGVPDCHVPQGDFCMLRGDVDHSGSIDISDLTFLVDYMFREGEVPPVPEEADVNSDGSLDISDLVHLVWYMFQDGPEPADCGYMVPLGRLAAGISEGYVVSAVYEDGETVITVDIPEPLRGLQIELLGETGAVPVNRADETIEMVFGQSGKVTRVGLLDLQGATVIEPGQSEVLRLAGRHELISARLTDLDAFTVIPSLRNDAGDAPLPDRFTLHQNYPNPFNPSTEIMFDLDRAERGNLSVYNVAGQKVLTLVDGHFGAGRHKVKLEGNGLSSGVYFYRLTGDSGSLTRKMILLK